MPRRSSWPSLPWWRLAIGMIFAALSASATADLPGDFQAPPQSARPWVYWFWMNGNITREGITADLEAMHKVGIGGCLIMHVKLGDIGKMKLGQMPPDGPVRFMSEDFRKLFRHAVAEADRLGMKIDMNNADGFTGSGGPWVPVEKSMKKLVWTETPVSGGQTISRKLAQPETILGFYRDVAVVAFPRQASLVEQMKAGGAVFSASAKGFDPEAIADGDSKTRCVLWRRTDKTLPAVTISFKKPYTADTLVLDGLELGRRGPAAILEISDDGKTFRPVGNLCLRWYPAAPTNTVRFDACTARHFRLRLVGNIPQVSVGDLNLGRSNKVHYWEAKAGFTRYGEWGAGSGLYSERKTGAGSASSKESSPISRSPVEAIATERVLDLSGSMDSEGNLSWQAPEGNWTVLRIGYTSTGIKNHPASEGGHGLECDKLHPSGAEAAFGGMLQRLIDTSEGYVARSFSHAHIDSWEVGIQNWTEGMAETFRERNGYDLTRFYPLLVAGHAVESNEASERFLWDLRQTLLAMMADNYLGRMETLCHENGLLFSSEAGGRQTFLQNPVGLLAVSDLPMGEFWPHEGSPRVDGKAAASVAHLYGKTRAGAESFTGALTFANWQSHPYRLKQIGDEAFCLGINHYVVHYCVHQAYEDFRPGFVMGPWGIHLDRMNTWWDVSRPWLDYLARCQFMLQQGQFVADVLYFPGENAPHYFGKRDSLSVPLPSGYDYDGCDRETLLHRLKVEDGRLVTPSGMRYRYLMLADMPTMTPELARRVRQLVDAGVKVIGPKPGSSPSLQGYPQCDREVRKIADSLWDEGRVRWGRSFEEIAAADELPADFEYFRPTEEAQLHYIHRRTEEADFYFVANGNPAAVSTTCTFRVAGRRPEIWDPETGRITRPAVFEDLGDRVRVPLHLERLQSVFVVFREVLPKDSIVCVSGPEDESTGSPAVELTEDGSGKIEAHALCKGRFELEYASGNRRVLNVGELPAEQAISGPWKLHFPPGWDAPELVELKKLISWSDHEQAGVKYFSGTAVYKTTFDAPAQGQRDGNRWCLDLGNVQVIAQVKVNGRELGTFWKPPFRVDVTAALKDGRNELEVAVTNLWPNRLIGDEQFPDDAAWEGIYLKSWPEWFLNDMPRPEPRRKAFTVVKHFGKDSPLLPSGLLGPVVLRPVRVVEVGP